MIEDVEMRTHKSNGAPLRVVSVDLKKEFRVPTTMSRGTYSDSVRRSRRDSARTYYQDYSGDVQSDMWDEDFMLFHD